MPELPEVETVVNSLKEDIVNLKIEDITSPNNYLKVFSNNLIENLPLLKEQKINSVTRRAKFIIINIDNGLFAIHLRMTGRLIFNQNSSISPINEKYISVRLAFSNGTKLDFSDVRKFGRFYFYSSIEEFNNNHKLGFEPLDDKTSKLSYYYIFKGSTRNIKSLLLDQSKVVGLGNIYVDEILWAAKIHPLCKANSISLEKCQLVYKVTKNILKKSIDLHGTTFLSFYFGREKTGNYQKLLKVFGRDKYPCLRCGEQIIKIRVAGRGTHICPKCQI
jgi:formamidopyrimidine-DNA glycosylase